jgi:GT2 family glycosyltransferase
MIAMPRFSVIIPTYHRNDLLAKCLDCLAPGVQTLAPEQYEVIVTDDGSETTAEQLIQTQYPWATWVPGPRQGPAANRNNGANYARGEWLVFTDDDCLPDANWLLAYAEAIEHTDALALEGAIHALGDPNQDLAECPVNLTGGCFWSANVVIQTNLFNQIGGFDQNYPMAAHEDQDIRLCLEKVTNILFVDAALVLHPVRKGNLLKIVKSLRKRCKTWAYFHSKNAKVLGLDNPLHILAFKYKFQLIALSNSLKKRHIGSVLVNLAMIIYGIPVIALELFRKT